MTKKRCLIGAAGALFLAAAIVLLGWGDAIFQRGNPIPYLLAAVQLDEDTPYALVDETEKFSVYITERDAQEKMIAAIEASTESRFLEQGGRGFFFENVKEHFVVVNEVYWGRYLVWNVPNQYNAL